jgi:hypothetical protein
MDVTHRDAQEAAEDVFFGQLVMNWARWFLIAVTAVLILGTADSTSALMVGVWPVVGLMALNFYLHGRRLAERPANPKLIGLASLMDVAIVSIAVFAGLGAGLGDGLQSPFFLAYFPVVLAFAFVMQPRLAVLFTGVVLASYAGATLAADGRSLLQSTDALEQLTARLIALAAVGGLGAYFWRIERRRRHEDLTPPPISTPRPAPFRTRR